MDDIPAIPQPSVPAAPARPDSSACFTCDALAEYSGLAEGYIDALAGTMYAPLMTLFLALTGFWAVYTGYRFWLALVSPMQVARDLFAIVIAYAILGTQGGSLITGIYSVSLEVMTGAALMAFSIGPGGAEPGARTGITSLMAATETGVAGVFAAAADVIASSSRFNPLPYLFALLLVLPYFLVVVAFFSKIVVSIFRLMMLGIFAPFLVLFFAFGWGRSMAFAGLKTLLSSVFVLFAASVSVGLLLYGVDTLVAGLDRDDVAGTNLLSSRYLTVLMLGWLGVALMTEGIGLANSITATLLSNTAAGTITAGVTGSAAWAGRTAWREGGGDALKALLGAAAALPGREVVSMVRGGAPGADSARRLRGAARAGIGKARQVLGFQVDGASGGGRP